MLVAPAAEVAGEVFNVGAGDLNYQVFDLAQRVAKGMEVPFEFEWYGDADHRSYRVNFDKIRQRLGWEPEYDAERGAREVACAIRERRVDPADPTTITLNVYKQLRASGTLI
jgi:nucleoside-diphosphate-sugar epimerase